ncbi:MAG TPA: pitrilysin family protein [Candidatus Binatia bacterium]
MNKILVVVLLVGSLLVSTGFGQAAMTPHRSVLNNGMVLLTSEQRTLPMVSIEMLIHAGARYDPPKQDGLANLTAELITEGTKRRTALQISESLDFLGASLAARSGEDLASVSLTVLKKDLPAGLELLAEVLTSAVFPQEEIERQKQAVIATIRAKQEQPGEIAEMHFAAAVFPQTPYGRPVEGNEASVKAITQASLREFYERYYRPNRSIIAVVGDISHQEAIEALNQAFSSWKKGDPPPKPLLPSAAPNVGTIRINKDLTQANIVLGQRGVGRRNPDYYALQVMNYILGGGGFSSRAMDSIRNERGLAYSVYSYFSAEKGRGTFQFVMQTKNETALQAIDIAKEEIRRIRQTPVSEAELNDAKDYLTGSFPLRFDTMGKVANFLAQVEYFELGLDYTERYPDLIRKITIDDVRRVAQKYLEPERMITVIVGNQTIIAGK